MLIDGATHSLAALRKTQQGPCLLLVARPIIPGLEHSLVTGGV